MKVEYAAAFILLMIVLWVSKDRIKNYISKPVNTPTLTMNHEYDISSMNIVSDNDISVVVDGHSYLVKLSAHAKEGAREEMASILQLSHKATMAVRSMQESGIVVDVYAYSGNNKFSLVSVLREKGLLYDN
jgi:hypothetical protein